MRGRSCWKSRLLSTSPERQRQVCRNPSLALRAGGEKPTCNSDGNALFRQTYGLIDETAWHIARGRALWHTLNVLDYGHATGDADLVREGRIALGHLASAE